MHTERHLDISINLSTFLLKNVGLWTAENPAELFRRNLMIVYCIWTTLFASFVGFRDFYLTWITQGDVFYVLANLLSMILAMIKLYVILMNKVEFIDLIVYMRDKFWNVNYDFHEEQILKDCSKMCAFFVTTVTSIGVCASMCYVLTPVIIHYGNNGSERMLPFNMWINTLLLTPYYEITFVIQVVSFYYLGVCYFCFDNIFCVMAIHLSGQFRILQYRFAKLCDVEYEMNEKYDKSLLINDIDMYYIRFKNYIRQHQDLINFYMKLENVYAMIILGQVLVFSLLICLFGYQILLAKCSFVRRCCFIFLMLGAMSLLFMFTYSCDDVMEQSDNIAVGAYSSLWMLMPMTRFGKMLRTDLILVIERSRRVCCLTAYGFFPISLETYTTIFSTATSYFTLLRNHVQGVVEVTADANHQHVILNATFPTDMVVV